LSFLSQIIEHYVSLPQAGSTEIESAFETIELSRMDLIVRAGEMANKLALIEEGYLRMFRLDRQGKETTVWIGGRGKFVTAISSFVERKPSFWNIGAITDSKIHIIKVDSHYKLCKKYSQWLDFENILLAKALSALEYRTFELMSMKAEERFQVFFQRNRDLFLNVPSKYIASMLGISEETLSRLKRKN